MKYIVFLVLILAVYAKKKQGIEINVTKLQPENGGVNSEECKNIYRYGFNYLVSHCDQIQHPKKADETFCMLLSSNSQLKQAYADHGNQVCDEQYTCGKFNDDSVDFLFTRVFETPIPTGNGRGLDYWFTEPAKIAQKYHQDKCQSLTHALH